ncbi:MAG: retroviral-like aspartic protease [Anaerolineae bacterium]|nr:retroviral-like aspartic protease [Anaerolineae bacterium]
MISYSTEFDPPAPVLAVQLTGIVHSRPRVTLPALLDTGSDFTAVPANLVSRLKLYAVRPQLLEDFSGETREEFLYGVRLGYANQPAREMQVMVTGLPFVILGRDWLEDYYLLLNGPEQTFLLSDTPLQENA